MESSGLSAESSDQLPGLTDRQTRRYARHLTLPGFGPEAQRKLRQSRVLVVGAGGLGSPAVLYLVAAGVGHITVIDDDVVEESNLQRQVIHRESDIGRPKAESAKDAGLRLDSEASITAIQGRLTAANAAQLFADHDVVLDGADNFATRYLSSDAAEVTGTPLVWATILQFGGQLSVFWPGHGPMLRDLFPDMPDPDSVPSCAAGGVLGAMVGQIGSMMVVEALKVLTGVGEPAVGKLVLIDALAASTRSLNFSADPDRPYATDLSAHENPQTSCGCEVNTADGAESTAPTDPSEPTAIGPNELAERLDGSTLVVDVREDSEREAGFIAGSVHIPLQQIQQQGWAAVREQLQVDPEKPDAETLVFHCRSGARSSQAIQILEQQLNSSSVPLSSQASHPRLVNLEGGMLAWQAAGLEVTH